MQWKTSAICDYRFVPPPPLSCTIYYIPTHNLLINLRDLRLQVILAKYDAFVAKVTTQLQTKVAAFLTCKEGELAAWLDNEATNWTHTTRCCDDKCPRALPTYHTYIARHIHTALDTYTQHTQYSLDVPLITCLM